MLPRRTFEPGEKRLSRVSVNWTDVANSMPNRWGVLYVTNQHLVLAAPRLSPLSLVLLWPVFGVIGLMYAGVPGATVVVLVLIVLLVGLPRRIAFRLSLAAVEHCVLSPSTGWRKLTVRDVVEIRTVDGRAWRFSTLARGQTSALPIVEALEQAGLLVGSANDSR